MSALNLALAGYSWRALARTAEEASAKSPGSAESASSAAPVATAAAVASGPSAERRVYPLPSLQSFGVVNGIDMPSMDQFWEKWRLVDVRYRTDNGEQRFVYANDVALKTMEQHGAKYPDGAVLGKVAFHGSQDPAFPASVEPDAFSRLQIMKKDSKAYPETDGWGYAVVASQDDKEKTPEEARQVAAACHACHKLVPDRDFVFSRSPFVANAERPPQIPTGMADRFSTVSVRSLDSKQQRTVAEFAGVKPDDQVHFMPMTLFAGSVHEASIALANLANQDRAIYLLSDPQSGHFVLADGRPAAGDAGAACQPGTRVYVTLSQAAPGLTANAVAPLVLCGDHLGPRPKP